MKRIAIVIAAMLSLLSANLTLAVPARAQTEPATVKVAVLNLGLFLPLYYVPKIARKYGLKIETVEFRRGLEAAAALKAGEVDIGVGGIEAAVAGAATGSPSVLVSGVASGGIAWVGRSDMKWNSIQDLKGKKFGTIRGVHELAMLLMFEKNGLTSSTEPGKADIQLVFFNGAPALNTALKTREADAITNAEPFASRGVVEGYGAPFLRPYDTPLGKISRAVFAHRNFVEKRPEVAQRYIDALVEATKTLRDNPKLAHDFAVGEALKGSISEEDWQLSVKNQTFDVDITLDEVQHYVDAMLKYKMIPKAMKAADFTDLSFLQKAKSKAGW